MYVCIFGFKGASTSKVIGARNEMMMDDYDGQMIFGDLVGLKLPDIRLTGEEKPRKKPHSGNLSRPGIEPGPAAWQARMLPLVPQRWTYSKVMWMCMKYEVYEQNTPFTKILYIKKSANEASLYINYFSNILSFFILFIQNYDNPSTSQLWCLSVCRFICLSRHHVKNGWLDFN